MRSVALEALSSLHEGRYSLEPQVYDQATYALTDDYERVRTAALRLTTSLALTTPDRCAPYCHSKLSIAKKKELTIYSPTNCIENCHTYIWVQYYSMIYMTPIHESIMSTAIQGLHCDDQLIVLHSY